MSAVFGLACRLGGWDRGGGGALTGEVTVKTKEVTAAKAEVTALNCTVERMARELAAKVRSFLTMQEQVRPPRWPPPPPPPVTSQPWLFFHPTKLSQRR